MGMEGGGGSRMGGSANVSSEGAGSTGGRGAASREERVAGGEGGINTEVERIANLMLHDGVSPDEQDPLRLAEYVRQVRLKDCGLGDSDDADSEEAARNIVYEALLYRKLKGMKDSGNILGRGSEFGAGFS